MQIQAPDKLEAIARKVLDERTFEAIMPDCTVVICTESPDVSFLVLPWLIPTEQSVCDMGWEIHSRLRDTPDNVFVLLAMTSLGAAILAVLVAFAEKGLVQIYQARALPGFRNSRWMFNCLLEWGHKKGCNKFWFETARKPGAFVRKYGFDLVGRRQVNGQTVYKLTSEN